MRTLKTSLMLTVTTALLAGGCSLLIEGQEDGRPCKEGRCPYGYICIDGLCEALEEPGPNGGSNDCIDYLDCSCEDGSVPVCGADNVCMCVSLSSGRIDGVGLSSTDGRFSLMGGQLGSTNCVSQVTERTELCGGFIQ